MARWAKCKGRKPDALVGQCPDHGEYIIWTTAEFEAGVVKEFPVCPDIEFAEMKRLIEIVEIYEKSPPPPPKSADPYHEGYDDDDDNEDDEPVEKPVSRKIGRKGKTA
jgi:hypothetical protein